MGCIWELHILYQSTVIFDAEKYKYLVWAGNGNYQYQEWIQFHLMTCEEKAAIDCWMCLNNCCCQNRIVDRKEKWVLECPKISGMSTYFEVFWGLNWHSLTNWQVWFGLVDWSSFFLYAVVRYEITMTLTPITESLNNVINWLVHND